MTGQKALRVQLGSDSYELFEQRLSNFKKGFSKTVDVVRSTAVRDLLLASGSEVTYE